MPKNKMDDMRSLKDTDQKTVGNLMIVANKVADYKGLSKSGFRIVLNNGKDAATM